MQDNFDETNETSTNKVEYEEQHYEYPEKTVFKAQNIIISDDDKIKNKPVTMMSKGLKSFLISAVVVLTILLGLLVFYIFYSMNGEKISISGITPNSQIKVNAEDSKLLGDTSIEIKSKPVDAGVLSAEEVYAQVSPCVVGIDVYDSGADILSDPVAGGSGISVGNGYIVTNSHVIGNSKQTSVKVILNTDEEFSGKVVGYDTKTDIAVIKIDKTDLKAASFGNSDEVKVGSDALAIGNPLGQTFAGSLTKGIISAVNRSVGRSKNFVKYIQADVPINSGNSGGALLDMYGQVIGVTVFKIRPELNCEGMGFAIPSNTVKTVVDDIIAKGFVSGRVRLGITGKAVTYYQAQIYNVPIGYIIVEIDASSNLAAAGARPSDIITKINDVNITSRDVLDEELSSHKAGDKVKLSLYRSSSNRVNASEFDINIELLEDKGETQNAKVKPNWQ